MRFANYIVIATFGLATSACWPSDPIGDQKYSVTKMGLQRIEDRKTWSYDSSVTFTAIQKYKIKNESGFDETHWLSFRVTPRSGKTVLNDTRPGLELVENGEFEFECQNYFSITSKEEGDIDPITCDFELVGVIPIRVKAQIASGSGAAIEASD